MINDLLYCMMRACQEEISAFRAVFCNSFRVAAKRRSLAHDESDKPDNRHARSKSLLTSGNTRICITSRCDTPNLGLPRLIINIIVLQKNYFVNKIFIDCALKCSTIN